MDEGEPGSDVQVIVITATDDSLVTEDLPAALEAALGMELVGPPPTLVTGHAPHRRSLLHWAGATARASGKLKRRLVAGPGEVATLCRLLLQRAGGPLLESDLLGLQRTVARARVGGGWPDQEAGAGYKSLLTHCGLVDGWEAVRVAAEQGPGWLLLLGLGPGDEELLPGLGSIRLAQVVSGKLELGQPGPPASLLADIGTAARELGANREVGSPGLSLAAACLRLLLNSRDELSLARALTDSGLVQPAQFSAMRRGARPGSPLYQAVLSFLRQVELGGRSYQPDEDNAMRVVEGSLSEFQKLMDKLQTRLEGEAAPDSVVRAVITCLQGWMARQAVPLTQAEGDRLLCLLTEVAVPPPTTSPALLLTRLLDLLAALPGPEGGTGATPARSARTASLLRTPQPDSPALTSVDPLDCMVETRSLGERLGPATPTAPPTFPRYRTCQDFTEGSPALPGSATRLPRTAAGATLRACGDSPTSLNTITDADTRSILAEVRASEEREAEQNREEAKENIRILKKRSRRCLSKEVDDAVREKMGMKKKKEDTADTVKPKSKPPSQKKKKFSTPKGQRKMTSFFKH